MTEAANYSPNLSPSDWLLVLDALQDAVWEMNNDLEETRDGDFYSEEDRDAKHKKVEEWRRISDLIKPLAKEGGER